MRTRQKLEKQQTFGFGVPSVKEHERLHIGQPIRWAEAPAHTMGEQLAVIHPRGWFRILENVFVSPALVTAWWPNCGGEMIFDRKTGKQIAGRSNSKLDWRLCPEDVAWLQKQPRFVSIGVLTLGAAL